MNAKNVGGRRRSVSGKSSNGTNLATVNGSTGNTISLKYRLVAVIVHHGNHIGGHYTTFRRILTRPVKNEQAFNEFVSNLRKSHPFEVSSAQQQQQQQQQPQPTSPTFRPNGTNSAARSNEWAHISDESVIKVSLKEVLQSQAYILYYEKIDC